MKKKWTPHYDIISHGKEYVDEGTLSIICPECYSSDIKIVYSELNKIDTVGVIKDTYFDRYQVVCDKCGCQFRVTKPSDSKNGQYDVRKEHHCDTPMRDSIFLTLYKLGILRWIIVAALGLGLIICDAFKAYTAGFIFMILLGVALMIAVGKTCDDIDERKKRK